MDVLITPEARRELEALRALKPKPGTWGALVGHRRGPRYVVEKVLAGGSPGTVPDEKTLEGIDGVWRGGTIGLVAVQPGAAFRRAVLGPAWYGKLVLEISEKAGRSALRPSVVEHDRKFHFSPLRIAPAGKAKGRE
jgi:hypothetical protein